MSYGDVNLPPLLLLGLALYLPLGVGLWLVARVRPAERVGAAFSLWWTVWSLTALNACAVELGVWSYSAPASDVLQGLPFGLWAGWALLWGWIAPLAHLPLWLKLALLWVADLLYMPLFHAFFTLHAGWWAFDLGMLALVVLPGHLLAHPSPRRLGLRNALLGINFLATFFYLIPATAAAAAGWSWSLPWGGSHLEWPQTMLLALLPFCAALTAFSRYGAGTPVPLEPAPKLITAGVFAYVANLMQLGVLLGSIVLAGWCGEVWLLLIGLVDVVYSVSFVRVTESVYLIAHHGERWQHYRQEVREWWPRWRPYVDPEQPPAVLYVGQGCLPCERVGRAFRLFDPVGLEIRPAQCYPGAALRRITYCHPATEAPLAGVPAVAAALQHLNLAFAVCGWLLELPGIARLAQRLVDTVGFGPRQLERRPS